MIRRRLLVNIHDEEEITATNTMEEGNPGFNCRFKAECCLRYELLNEGLYTDVTFQVDNAEIRAHKLLLASCSPVFRRMFQTNMEESISNTVKITDVSASTFRTFLEFIYTDEVKNVKTHIYDLLMLGDKYEILPLVEYCDTYIAKSLTTENVVKSFIAATQFQRKELTKKIWFFIEKNFETVKKNCDWQTINLQYVTLLQEMYKSISQQHTPDLSLSTNSGGSYDTHTWSLSKQEEISSKATLHLHIDNKKVELAMTLRKEDSEYMISLGTSDNYKQISAPLCFDFTLRTGDFINPVITKRFVFWNIPAPYKELLTRKKDGGVDGYEQSPMTRRIFGINIKSLGQYFTPFTLTVEVRSGKHMHAMCELWNLKDIDQHFSDVTITVQGTEFRLHKVILANSSEYFKNLLKENQNEYDIADITSADFEEIKNCIYRNMFPVKGKITTDLLLAALTLQVEKLVQFLTDKLIRRLDNETAIDLCIVSHSHSLAKLKLPAVQYIRRNLRMLSQSSNWPSMVNQPELLEEILMQKI